jgi:hypothetical protein
MNAPGDRQEAIGDRAEESKVQSHGLLIWVDHSDGKVTAHIKRHPETTVFLLDPHSNGQVALSGAFVPDDEDNCVYVTKRAKAIAELYLAEWLHGVAKPLFEEAK